MPPYVTHFHIVFAYAPSHASFNFVVCTSSIQCCVLSTWIMHYHERVRRYVHYLPANSEYLRAGFPFNFSEQYYFPNKRLPVASVRYFRKKTKSCANKCTNLNRWIKYAQLIDMYPIITQMFAFSLITSFFKSVSETNTLPTKRNFLIQWIETPTF